MAADTRYHRVLLVAEAVEVSFPGLSLPALYPPEVSPMAEGRSRRRLRRRRNSSVEPAAVSDAYHYDLLAEVALALVADRHAIERQVMLELCDLVLQLAAAVLQGSDIPLHTTHQCR